MINKYKTVSVAMYLIIVLVIGGLIQGFMNESYIQSLTAAYEDLSAQAELVNSASRNFDIKMEDKLYLLFRDEIRAGRISALCTPEVLPALQDLAQRQRESYLLYLGDVMRYLNSQKAYEKLLLQKPVLLSSSIIRPLPSVAQDISASLLAREAVRSQALARYDVMFSVCAAVSAERPVRKRISAPESCRDSEVAMLVSALARKADKGEVSNLEDKLP